MTSGPDQPESTPSAGDPAWGIQPPPPPPPASPGYDAPAYAPAPYGAPAPGYAAPGYAAPGFAAPGYPGAYGVSPAAPYGIDPRSGIPYSDKQKLVAGLLQIFLGGFGIGRFYIGDTKIGVIQIVVTVLTCGIGSLWGLVDGIIMLSTDSKDANGYVLRP